MGFCRHSLLYGILPTQGSNPSLLPLQADSLWSEPPGKLMNACKLLLIAEIAFPTFHGWDRRCYGGLGRQNVASFAEFLKLKLQFFSRLV